MKKKPKGKIVFCVPSFNEADSIGGVVKVIDKGLSKYFKGYLSFIVNADNHSPDNTKKAFLKTPTKHKKVYLDSGARGKGRNIKLAFEYAKKIKADAVGFIDGDITSADPIWVKKLIDPIFKGYDYVFPIYLRGKYDASITKHLMLPVTNGFLNTDIRQPIGGEFAASLEAVETFLARSWPKAAYLYGIDIFLTTESIFHNLRMAQTFLGVKAHKLSAPKLNRMFLEVADILFRQLANHQAYWRGRDVPKKLVKILTKPGRSQRAPQVPLDYDQLKKTTVSQCRSCWKDIVSIWKGCSVNMEKLLAATENENFSVTSEIWAEIIYSFVDKSGGFKKDELLALRALFFMRILSFYEEISDKSFSAAEKEVMEQIKIFRNVFSRGCAAERKSFVGRLSGAKA